MDSYFKVSGIKDSNFKWAGFRIQIMSFGALHCVDRIYRDTPSARIDRLMPTWIQPSDGRFYTGKRTSVSQPPAYGCLAGY